jgi:hypothetical protein
MSPMGNLSGGGVRHGLPFTGAGRSPRDLIIARRVSLSTKLGDSRRFSAMSSARHELPYRLFCLTETRSFDETNGA